MIKETCQEFWSKKITHQAHFTECFQHQSKRFIDRCLHYNSSWGSYASYRLSNNHYFFVENLQWYVTTARQCLLHAELLLVHSRWAFRLSVNTFASWWPTMPDATTCAVLTHDNDDTVAYRYRQHFASSEIEKYTRLGYR